MPLNKAIFHFPPSRKTDYREEERTDILSPMHYGCDNEMKFDGFFWLN